MEKIVWIVMQRSFIPNAYQMFDWENVFSNKEEAVKLYNERLGLYQLQAEALENVEVEDFGDMMYVLVNNEAILSLELLEQPIDEIVRVGSVILEDYLK